MYGQVGIASVSTDSDEEYIGGVHLRPESSVAFLALCGGA